MCTKCRSPRYEPVEEQTVYTVVVPSYMAMGGDNYTMIRDEMLKHNSGEMFVPGEASSRLSLRNVSSQRLFPSRRFGHFGRLQLHQGEEASSSSL